jgi:hypothetical protein
MDNAGASAHGAAQAQRRHLNKRLGDINEGGGRRIWQQWAKTARAMWLSLWHASGTAAESGSTCGGKAAWAAAGYEEYQVDNSAVAYDVSFFRRTGSNTHRQRRQARIWCWRRKTAGGVKYRTQQRLSLDGGGTAAPQHHAVSKTASASAELRRAQPKAKLGGGMALASFRISLVAMYAYSGIRTQASFAFGLLPAARYPACVALAATSEPRFRGTMRIGTALRLRCAAFIAPLGPRKTAWT